MVELPLDDAATRYEKLAEKVNDIRFGLDTSELDGAVAEALMASAVGLNEFTSRTAEILMEQANAVRVQHAEDEQLRDAPKPADVRELEQNAQQLAVIARYSVNPTAVATAEVAAQAAAEKRLEREIALSKHTSAAAANAPRMQMDPPSLMGVPGIGGGPEHGSSWGGGINNINPKQSNPVTPDKIGHGGGTPDKIGPGGGTPDKIGPGGGSISDTDVGTTTSGDMMGSGAPQQAMMGTPQAAGQQQPTMPSMSGTGAQGAGTPSGMLSSNPSGLNSRNRKRDDKDRRDGGMDLSSGGVVGAVPVGTGGVDRGISVSGVTTDKDTTGRAGMTNLSAAGSKPGGDGNNAPRGNMMRGGMMGGMGGMGSGANTPNVKSKADNPIVSALKDRYLHGFDSLREGVEGGMVGRNTAVAPTLDGTDQFLDDGKTKPNNGTGA